jgi:hypothetical protein
VRRHTGTISSKILFMHNNCTDMLDIFFDFLGTVFILLVEFESNLRVPHIVGRRRAVHRSVLVLYPTGGTIFFESGVWVRGVHRRFHPPSSIPLSRTFHYPIYRTTASCCTRMSSSTTSSKSAIPETVSKILDTLSDDDKGKVRSV